MGPVPSQNQRARDLLTEKIQVAINQVSRGTRPLIKRYEISLLLLILKRQFFEFEPDEWADYLRQQLNMNESMRHTYIRYYGLIHEYPRILLSNLQWNWVKINSRKILAWFLTPFSESLPATSQASPLFWKEQATPPTTTPAPTEPTTGTVICVREPRRIIENVEYDESIFNIM